MKHLITIVLTFMVLVAAVTGCGRTPRYDGRLMAADSLMRTDPDSALAIVGAIDRDSLGAEGDRAYRDLLLTQARYKAYVTATSDSDINRALAYYRAHPKEREKLTRAYIYKGAVMEELGHPDSAMLYYKHAEATADEKDYSNLAQINIRVASLYRNHYADFQKCYEKYSKALKYYEYLGDRRMQQKCIYNMGVCASITHTSDALELWRRSLNLAKELKDSFHQYESKESMCRHLSMTDSTLNESKRIAFDCLDNYSRYVNEDLLLDIAYVYVRENKYDSAMYFIGLVDVGQCSDPIHKEQVQYRRNDILYLIAEHNGDLSLSKSARDSATQVSDQIHNRKTKHSIQSAENQYEKALIQKKDAESDSLRIAVWVLSALFVMALSALSYYYLSRLNRTEALIKEIRENGINTHEDLLRQISGKNGEIAHFVSSLVELIHRALQVETVTQKLSLNSQLKDLVSKTIDDGFWQELLVQMDKRHNGLISRLSRIPQINKTDLRFIALVCCGFSSAEIAFIMDYSPKYISNKRKAVERKLGQNVTLQTYLREQAGLVQKDGDYRKQ